MGYRIAQAAELSGVPATTIRYYEDQGLLRPADRAPNGYRTYDDRDVARLRFVNRARALDLPTDDLAELVELWEHDRCAPVAQRLRDQVAERLADTQRRLAGLAALAGDLQRVLSRLQHPAHDGPCIEGQCVCLHDDPTTPAPSLPLVNASDGDEPIACTLDPDHMPARMDDWQQLLAWASGQHPIAGGVSLQFPIDADLAGRLTTLAAAEQGCCSFFTFALQVTADAMHLQVTAPPDAADMVVSLFGTPGPAVPATT